MTSEMAPVAEVCQYTPLHRRNGVPATTTVQTATLGAVPCCQACKELYQRLAGGRTDTRHGG
jgi:hypothetical protein